MENENAEKGCDDAGSSEDASVGQASCMVMAALVDGQSYVLADAAAQIAQLEKDLADERETRLALGGIVGEQKQRLAEMVVELLAEKARAAKLQKALDEAVIKATSLTYHLEDADAAKAAVLEERDNAQAAKRTAEEDTAEAKEALAEFCLASRSLHRQNVDLEEQLDSARLELRDEARKNSRLEARILVLEATLAASQKLASQAAD